MRTENQEAGSDADELFLFDISHPYGPTGHRFMAELLIGLTQLTAGSLQAHALQDSEHTVAEESLPPPVIPGNYDKRAASCSMSVSGGVGARVCSIVAVGSCGCMRGIAMFSLVG